MDDEELDYFYEDEEPPAPEEPPAAEEPAAAEGATVIRRFPIEDIKLGKVIILLGKRGTGKSVLVKDILYHYRNKLDTAMAIAATTDTIEMFEDCLPPGYIHDEFDDDRLDRLIKFQKFWCNPRIPSEGKYRAKRNVGIFLDDMAFEKSIWKSLNLRYTYMNGRHENITLLQTFQYMMDVPTWARANVDYVFVLRTTTLSDRQKLHKHFFSVIPNFLDFCELMDSVTQDYGVLVFDNTVGSNHVSDCVFKYRADPSLGRFLVGRRRFLKLNYNEVRSAEEIQEQNMREYKASLEAPAAGGAAKKKSTASKFAVVSDAELTDARLRESWGAPKSRRSGGAEVHPSGRATPHPIGSPSER